jgi:hypothetical protein
MLEVVPVTVGDAHQNLGATRRRPATQGSTVTTCLAVGSLTAAAPSDTTAATTLEGALFELQEAQRTTVTTPEWPRKQELDRVSSPGDFLDSSLYPPKREQL